MIIQNEQGNLRSLPATSFTLNYEAVILFQAVYQFLPFGSYWQVFIVRYFVFDNFLFFPIDINLLAPYLIIIRIVDSNWIRVFPYFAQLK